MPNQRTSSGHSGSGRTPSADVESMLLAAAERVLEKVGLDGLTVRAVALEARVAPMGVYNRFSNKAGLLGALMARAFETLAVALDADDPDPISRLRTSATGYRAFALDHPARYRMMFFGGFVPNDASTALRARGRSAFTVIVDLFSYAIDQGSLGPRDARMCAQQLWSAMHGAVVLELTGLGFFDNQRDVYTGLIEAVLAGMQRPQED